MAYSARHLSISSNLPDPQTTVHHSIPSGPAPAKRLVCRVEITGTTRYRIETHDVDHFLKCEGKREKNLFVPRFQELATIGSFQAREALTVA